MTLLPDLETNCEILWAKVQISASEFLTLGCFYRPDSKISTSEELAKSLDLMPKNSNQTIVLVGDFNLPGIDWDNGVVNPKAANKSQCELLLSSLDTHALAQIHKEPTREENILDLLITNKPGLIKSSHSVPGISDHCAVVTELDIDPPYRRTKPRQFKKANWEAIRQQIRSCWTSFSESSPSRSVNENWLKLKSILNQCHLYQLKWLPLGKIYLGYPNHSLQLFGKKHLYIANPSVRIKLTFGQNINYVNGRPSVPSGLQGGLFWKTNFLNL